MENIVQDSSPAAADSTVSTAAPAPAAQKAAPKKTAAKAVKKAAPKKAPARKAPAKAEKVEKAEKPVKAEKPAKESKPAKPEKLVRDSFTIPRSEYEQLQALKQRAAALDRPAKKSEVLRAGIQALLALDDAALLAVFAQVPVIKTGRPSAA